MINTLDDIMKGIISQEFYEFIIIHEFRVNQVKNLRELSEKSWRQEIKKFN